VVVVIIDESGMLTSCFQVMKKNVDNARVHLISEEKGNKANKQTELAQEQAIPVQFGTAIKSTGADKGVVYLWLV
jgi:hypothetical protein